MCASSDQRFRHWRAGGVRILMRLLFNPFRVVPSGRSDHSRGSHPGLFCPTLSASVLRVRLKLFRRSMDDTGLRRRNRGRNRCRRSKSVAISNPMPIPKIFRNATSKRWNSTARGANPGECSDDGVSTLKGLHRILAAWAHHHLPRAHHSASTRKRTNDSGRSSDGLGILCS